MNIDQRVRVVIGDLVIQAQAQQQKIEEQAEQIAKLEGEVAQANAQVEMYKARTPVIQGAMDSLERRLREADPREGLVGFRHAVGGFEQAAQDDAMKQVLHTSGYMRMVPDHPTCTTAAE